MKRNLDLRTKFFARVQTNLGMQIKPNPELYFPPNLAGRRTTVEVLAGLLSN
jgi:hypothetical protein